MHDTYYNPDWGFMESENKSEREKIDAAMVEKEACYRAVQKCCKLHEVFGRRKPIHIGETGGQRFRMRCMCNSGSKATDEYKSAQYYKLMREWTNQNGISLLL
jgi:hypothetical protein